MAIGSRRYLEVGSVLLAPVRSRKSIQRVNLRLPSLPLAIFVILSPRGFAEEPIAHPFIEQKDIKSETCLTCHPEKKQGKFVHSAVGMGCENCHQAASEKNKTTINLVATGGNLCAMCHEAAKDPTLHGPYKNGQCLICHDPHSSEFKAQTRAAGNSLCLACHAVKQAQGETVTLFGSQKISRADFDAIPKIELDPTLRFGHPWATHPVAQVVDLLHEGEKMSCLSCHTPHASAQENLIVSVKGAQNICTACHQAIDERAAAKNKSQSQPQARQQPQQGPDAPRQSGDKEKP
jgi:predicted CXXCH cytochrome family protein